MADTPPIIRNDLELAAALERAEQLSGRTDDSGAASELAEIQQAVDVYLGAMKALRNADANPHVTNDEVDGEGGEE